MGPLPTYNLLGDGPLVLMLHGSGGSFRSFAPQVETLASQGYRAAAWNMPGYGLSAPVEPYGFKGLAERCIGLIEGLSGNAAGVPAGCTLVGQGMGGMVALEVALRRPELVHQLVLSATAPAVTPGDGYARHIDEALALIDGATSQDALAETLVPSVVGPDALAAGVRLATHCLAQVNLSVWRRALLAMRGFDRRAALAELHPPTLLVSGDLDRVAPLSAWPALPRTRLARLPGVGHLPNLEAPDAFDALLLDFLSEARPPVWH